MEGPRGWRARGERFGEEFVVCLWDWVYFYGIAKGSLTAGGGTLPPSLRLFGIEWSWELPIACITYLGG
jgi:hypothetical protein